MTEITFITGNPGKVKDIKEYLHIEVGHRDVDLHEIQSLDLREIVEDKARRAYEVVQSPVLVEDVSLVFTAMKSLPGPLIKWFLKSIGPEGLCKIADGLDNRKARAEIIFALYDGVEMHLFDAAMDGSVAPEPRGENGYGWDPIYIPEGSTKTRAEMTREEQNQGSMRKAALEKLALFLEA